ncbi:MAG: T9SS type A sorting domain-containing protein, partial [Bacteroidota bacterium]
NDLPDITISCNFSYDPSNLSASFGKVVTSIAAQENITINDAENNVNTPQPFTWGQDALVTDNCGDNLIISYDSTFNLDATCNTGTISRTITVSSGSGTPAIITQTITIQDFDPFNPDEDAVWMGNMDLYLTATDCNFDVGSLGAPTITNDNCSKAVPAIAEELVFNRPTAQLGAGMCLKILRKWEIRDWCQPDSAWCNPNLLNGEQTIIVWDTFPATFAFDRPDCDTITITSGATTANYAATATITDNCTNVFDATNVSYTITPGGVLTGGTGTSINADLPFGVHEVVFTAVDDCGTSATDTLKVVVINDPCTFVNQFNAVNFGSDPINVAVTDVYTGGIVGATLDISGIGSGASVTFNCTDIQYNTQYPTTYNGNVNIPAFGGAPAAQCPTSFIVQDLDPPTLVCNPPASFELDANNQAVITINDMVPTANDNCDTSNLIFSFQELDFSAPNDPLNPPANLAKLDTMIDCSDLSVDGTVQVNLWVYDLTGKGIQCDPFLSFTNGPNSDCANAKPSTIPAVITGQILDEENGQVENVVVSMNGDRISSSVTQTDGTFRFSDVPTGFNYSIEPAKDDKPLNGVSTYDLVQISKHVLELEKLNSPYKMIAADANRNGEITAIDLVEIRKLILFVDRDFQENTSWRFIDADYLFPNSDDPFTGTFPEVYNINDLQRDMRINFVAVKVGDVNCSANPNEVIGSEDRHAVGDLVFQLPDLEITAGQTYEVPFHLSKDAELFGYQYTLEFDQEALEFDDIQAGTLPGLSKGNFGLQLLEQGAITTSWSTTQAIKGEKLGELFRIRFRAKRSGQLSDFLTAGSRFTTAEGYNAEGDLLNIALQFDEQQVETADSRFLLYQNRPNPFRAETLIGFHLPQSSVAELTVFDLSGKLILRKERLFKKGFNEFSINQSELQQAGVLYYQLKTDRHTAVKKMTVLE